MAATQNTDATGTRSSRRKTSNRQAAYSFLSSIQLDPSAKKEGPLNPTQEEELQQYSNGGQQSESSRSVATASKDSDAAQVASPSAPQTPIEPPMTAADSRRIPGGTKGAVATTFLAGLSLRGDTTAPQSPEGEADQQIGGSTGFQRDQENGVSAVGSEALLSPNPAFKDATSQYLVQRSSSTPSLSSGRDNDLDMAIEPARKAHAIRSRKLTSTDTRSSKDASRSSAFGSRTGQHHRESSGLLSALLAREKDPDTRTSSLDTGSAPSYRNALQKAPARWLGPLTDHVYIKPLITSGTAHIVKKIFRRPSVSIPKHIASHSQAMSPKERSSSSRQLQRSGSQTTFRLNQPQDDRRHIFYKGEDLSTSCLSLGENLSQHAYMFTTKHGSPLVMSSVLRYNDDKAPNKRRRRRFDREYLQQITKEALIRKKANSFAHLLTQSNALDPEPQESSSYDPYYLDDPELKTGKNRTVISLACYMGSVIQYTRPSDLKRELNEHFRLRHPTIDPSITLSKIRKIKTDLLAISEELDLEISTAALAYAYFEKLILKGSWKGKDGSSLSNESASSPVTKENRKLIACVCLLLAYKVNEPKRPPGEFIALMKQMSKHMDVSSKDIKEHEFQVFSLLEFNLYLPRQEFLPHFEQILYRQDYINVQEYLGEDEFYSVGSPPRKPTE
ncbi:CDK5 and ABL1 enzyme substrate 1 [Mortierella alpina]|nr:CDK5 and ABL1 enzyme substrate 1 [Mortierella alpina]